MAQSELELEHAPNTAASKELIIKAAKETWQSLEDRILFKLSETMPNQVQAVIEADGWYNEILDWQNNWAVGVGNKMVVSFL